MAKARAYYGRSDLASMFKEWGVEVSVGGQWYTRGILDEADDALLQLDSRGTTGLSARLMVLTVESDTLGPGLVEGADIEVDTVVHRVNSVHRMGDGATTRIVVTRK